MRSIHRRSPLVHAFALASGLGLAREAHAAPTLVYSEDVEDVLWDAWAANPEAPALAGALLVGDTIHYAAIGQKCGYSGWISSDDTFQLGSLAKPITGALLAKGIQLGYLDWHTQMEDAMPDLVSAAPGSTYADVTLSELNAHTSGMPYFPVGGSFYESEPNLTMRRLLYTYDAVDDPPNYTPGIGWDYSGGGNITALMLELATQTPYEQLLEAWLFQPNGMTTAGLDAPTTCEHEWDGISAISEMVPEHDGRSVGSPVGGISMSVKDLGRFAYLVLTGSSFYGVEQWRQTRTAPGNTIWSSAGWRLAARSSASGLRMSKGGSNGANGSEIALYPKRGAAVLVLTNYADANDDSPVLVDAREGLDDLLDDMIGPGEFPFQNAPTYQTTGSAGATYSASYGSAKAFDGNYGTRWATPAGTTSSWLQTTWYDGKTVDRAVVTEAEIGDGLDQPYVPFRVSFWLLELKVAGVWTGVTMGIDLGVYREISFAERSNVTGARLNVWATEGPTIAEFHVLERPTRTS